MAQRHEGQRQLAVDVTDKTGFEDEPGLDGA